MSYASLMMMEDILDNWLSLNEYSNKYQVSLSTLRRRIKSDGVEFTFRYGKYFLKDVSLQGRTSISSPHTHKPSVLKPKATEDLASKTFSAPQKEVLPQADLSAYSFFHVEEDAKTELSLETKESNPVLTSQTSTSQSSTNQMNLESQKDLALFRMKTDYELIIQKQKTQIVKLQTELSNIETLVMALEK